MASEAPGQWARGAAHCPTVLCSQYSSGHGLLSLTVSRGSTEVQELDGKEEPPLWGTLRAGTPCLEDTEHRDPPTLEDTDCRDYPCPGGH